MKFLLSISCLSLSLCLTAQDYKIENNEVKITKEIVFKTGSDELLPESDEALHIIKKFLDDKSYISLLRVEGHTGKTGDAEKGQQLSEKRAMAICRKLVSFGADCKKLLPAGFGGTKPVADNSTPEGNALNSRISFVIASLRGKAIGGMPADGGGKIAGDICN
jgi:OmpA-OmpF porin, OOP family